ncbi:SDR family oxidoreductase, partial [Actinomadura sp. DSM 109109]|nr:SDR family oxidoreductase [Actinomadura lepetitiana]
VYRESFEMHTMSQILLLRAVLPAMREAGWGRFAHIGSATAKEPAGNIHHAVANTSRPSTIGLLKTVSDEYAQYGISVNTVAPGWIASSGMDTYDGAMKALIPTLKRHVPVQRLALEAEVSAGIVFLLSPAAAFITGVTLQIDGGASIASPLWPRGSHDRSVAFDGFHRAVLPEVLK